MVSAALTSVLILLQVAALQHVSPIQHARVMSGSSGDLTRIKIGLQEAVVINLPAEMHEVVIGDRQVVTVVPRSTQRAALIGDEVGRTAVLFYTDDGVRIGGFDVFVSDDVQAQTHLAPD
jgi:Flp pilus assembly secretin CpaC